MDKLLSIRKVAKIFDCSPRTIYRWIEERKVFRVVKHIEGRYLIPEEEVLRVYEQGSIENLNSPKPERRGRKVISRGIE